MELPSTLEKLPLLYTTPDTWANLPLKNTLALLNDHAYLERKAATNALDLLNRWGHSNNPNQWIVSLSTIARDETQHLNSVSRILMNRGGALSRTHRSQYAADLRDLVRDGLAEKELLDRLLVSTLIEARSCERFDILARMCQEPELSEFYRNLWSCEFGHHTAFIRLAETVVSQEEASKRWEEYLTAESKIIQSQPIGPLLHSRCP